MCSLPVVTRRRWPAPAPLRQPVEKIAAHRADQVKRAVVVVQRGGEQVVEVLALGVVGQCEQLFKLVHQQHKGGVGPALVAQVQRQRARVAPQGLVAGEGIAPGGVVDQAVFQRLGQTFHRLGAGQQRAQDMDLAKAGARPQRAAKAQHRQQAGLDQAGFARAAVALHLQPTGVAGAGGARLGRVAVAGVAQQAQRVQRLLAAAEEPQRIVGIEAGQAHEGAALARGRRRGVGAPGAITQRLHQARRQRLAGHPALGLEQRQKGRQAAGPCAGQQHRVQWQALGLVMRAEVAVQRRLHLAGHPARNAVTADQHDKGAALADRLLQPGQPAVAREQVLHILEHGYAGLLQRGAQQPGGGAVGIVVVAEKGAHRGGRHPGRTASMLRAGAWALGGAGRGATSF